MLRLATAIVLLPVLYFAVRDAPVWLFFVLAVGCILRACWECYGVLENDGARPFKALGLLGCAAVSWSYSGMVPLFAESLPLVAVAILASILGMMRRERPEQMFDALVSTLFPVLFIGLTLSHLIALRLVPSGLGGGLVLFLLGTLAAGDSAAYYVGSSLGKRPLAPSISPKKTWEGAIGGAVGGVLGALIGRLWFVRELPLEHAVLLGAILGLCGILGDLSASVIKRAANAKDFSNLLPGHGGMLDRMDSILFGAPTLYYYYLAFVEGGI